MSRRDTIIISVLVNAALLAVLFTTAISKNNVEEPKLVNKTFLEESSINKSVEIAKVEDLKKENTSAISEKPDIQKQFTSLMEKDDLKKDVLENSLALKSSNDNEEDKIVYKLPDLAKLTNEKEDEKISLDTFEIIVKSGDTLEKIARINQVRISDITNLNNLQNSFLRIGQKLLIPKSLNAKNSNVSPVLKTEDKKIVQNPEFYIVKVGDNPYTIAIKHSIKPNELLKLNNLDEKKAKKLKPGDKLRIR